MIVMCVASVNEAVAAAPPTVTVEPAVQKVPVPVRATVVPPEVGPEVMSSVIVPAALSDKKLQRASAGSVVDSG